MYGTSYTALQPRKRTMSRTHRFLGIKPATPSGSIVAFGMLLLMAALALAGCGDPGAIAAVEPTPSAFPPPPTDIPAPPPGPTPEALDFPLPAPSAEERIAVSDQSCIDCHTDEETLKAVATEEEVSEVESEGEG
jgi:hypothetical protein